MSYPSVNRSSRPLSCFSFIYMILVCVYTALCWWLIMIISLLFLGKVHSMRRSGIISINAWIIILNLLTTLQPLRFFLTKVLVIWFMLKIRRKVEGIFNLSNSFVVYFSEMLFFFLKKIQKKFATGFEKPITITN